MSYVTVGQNIVDVLNFKGFWYIEIQETLGLQSYLRFEGVPWVGAVGGSSHTEPEEVRRSRCRERNPKNVQETCPLRLKSPQ